MKIFLHMTKMCTVHRWIFQFLSTVRCTAYIFLLRARVVEEPILRNWNRAPSASIRRSRFPPTGRQRGLPYNVRIRISVGHHRVIGLNLNALLRPPP